ncbi:MFS transporter [Actinophytocola gossypii]|uniref:MFS transporter n=1 Tax=Actinophytocola gossypii TaxID=2812003 RepID=A0ABT2J353_9PSEU|nr:MFS transporter [Actinophytocola gossypii]MCT2582196.1 MFS transporter [Actinophytocola gossypii]
MRWSWFGVLAVADSVTLVTLAGGLLAGSVFRIVAMSARRLVFTAMVEPEARFTANALLGTSTSLALYAVGPVLGGVLSTAASPGTAVLVNGLSLVVLAVAVAFAAPAKAGAVSGASVSVSGFQVLRRIPVAARLLVVVFGFNLFYMPVEVALPLLVRGLDGSGVALGLVWSGFGVGALLGAVLANRLQRFSGQKILVAIIGGWAATVLLLLAAPSTPFAVAVFFVGGLVYAPFTPVVHTLVQSALEPAEQQPLITLWTAGSVLAAPIGLALAGPLVHGMGPEGALLVSALLTVALVPFAGAGLRTTRFRAKA